MASGSEISLWSLALALLSRYIHDMILMVVKDQHQTTLLREKLSHYPEFIHLY